MSWDLDDDAIDGAGPPADVFWRKQISQLRYQLQEHPPTDPNVLARLQRDLLRAERAVDEITLEDHWASGEGDRKLF